MRTLDLDSLEIFRTVVQEGGIIRAAGKLGRVQSNVTTRIKQLEQRLGRTLFRKQGRSIVLSPEGELLLSYTQRLFRLADEAETALRTEGPRGVLRIGSLESTAGSRLGPLLARYHQQHPGVVVELATGTTGALVQRVAGFELEAAFVSEPFTAPGLASQPVYEEELVLVTPRELDTVRRAQDLAGRTLIAFANGCSYRKRIEDWLGAAAVMPARTLEFASYQAMIACVAAGTGFAIVPRSLLAALRSAGDVRQHELPARIRRNRTHLVWNGAPSTALARLQDLLAA
ncbi:MULTISPECIES: LysR family transcriptional regulator [Ramlibacter]|uniref:LysR family transcriptional regulator n=1 Tax=Ramlibacter pinisoli TaxID=2682844 RepID=A0A6N8IMD8_9BURK|nr:MULTISPECIES: LysR family transcriptional regulator [Ramlibacter]MBA2960679.1 LysR family transcriptional regulator [Ramlibacter sp. CGMCC 1.13660]MVQ28009.1 LysR family transcriptional regulator [Ramlibacter pinisoli]